MLSPHTRLTRRPLLAAGVTLALFGSLSACGSVTGDAARVGDKALSDADFSDLLDGYTSATGTGLLPTGNVDAQVARIILQDWIGSTALERTLSDYGVEISDEDLLDAQETLSQQQGFADAPDTVQSFYIRATAVRTVTGETFSPDPEELADLYAAGPEESGVACLRLILTDTRADIDSARARLDAGEDFATVAREVSTDTSAEAGGILQDNQSGSECYSLTMLVEQIVQQIGDVAPTLKPGVVSDPIEIPEVGWVLLTLRPFSEVASDAADIIGPITASRLANSAVDNATVWVNPEYGRWDSEARRIVATSQ